MIKHVYDLSQKTEWLNALRKLPISQQDIYFLPEYFELNMENGAGDARCFVFEDGDDVAVYPLIVNSVSNLGLIQNDIEYYDIQGSYGYSGIASSNYKKKFRSQFFKYFNKYCDENNIIAEFTRFHPIIDNYHFAKDDVNISMNRNTVMLDLTKGYDHIWNNDYSSRNRNMLKKSEKKGLNSNIVTGSDYLLHFRDFYINTMKDVKAEQFYFFQQSYFENLDNYLGDNYFIINVYYKNKVINSLLVLYYGNYVHYHLSARDRKYSSLGANNYGLDVAIKHSIDIGSKIFHFGGGNTQSPNDSLLKFKTSFSKTKAEYYIGNKVHNQVVYDEICAIWEKKNPDKKDLFRNYFLKYRILQ